MGIKNRMILIGGVAILLIVAASVTVSLIHKKSKEAGEYEIAGVKDELGIHYGGSFDEFADGNEEDWEKGKDSESDVSEMSESEKADLEKTPDDLLKEFEKADSGDIYGMEDENSGDRLKLHNDDVPQSEMGNTEITDGDDADWDMEGTELPGYGSDGYAEHKVICDAQSLEEAEDIAAQITGTLLSWDYGVATIQIEGSVDELLEQLEQQGSNLKLYRKYNFTKK